MSGAIIASPKKSGARPATASASARIPNVSGAWRLPSGRPENISRGESVARRAVAQRRDRTDSPGRSHGTIATTPDACVDSSSARHPGQSGSPHEAQTTAAGTSESSKSA